MSKKELRKVSFFNWIITLILTLIPGVNIVYLIFSAAFASAPSKKTYSAAALVLTLVVYITLCVLVFGYGETVVKWAEALLATAE